MNRMFLICTIVVELICSTLLTAQDSLPTPSAESSGNHASMLLSDRPFGLEPTGIPIQLRASAALPSMTSEQALRVYQQRVGDQTRNLASYSATSYIRVQLPATSQSGEYQLRCDYVAPRMLTFKVIYSAGDAFVKTNVIARLLRAEVDHVQKDDPALTSLTSDNYVFSYKSTGTTYGRLVHIYQVKPRSKRLGLFKGRVYLDARTGTLVRTEGAIVKSPSVFIKNIHLVQTYTDTAASPSTPTFTTKSGPES